MSSASEAEDKIAKAFLDLLDEKPADSISVKEIAERAGVSRVTYYRHYSSKEEILERYACSVLDGIVDCIREGKVRTGDEFWELVSALLGSSGLIDRMNKAGLVESFFMMFESRMEEIFSSVFRIDLSVSRNVLSMEFVMGGLISLLRTEMLERRGISREETADFIKELEAHIMWGK